VPPERAGKHAEVEGGIALHIFNDLLCFLGSRLPTNKILLFYVSRDVALSVVELENLLDVMVSNPITLIL